MKRSKHLEPLNIFVSYCHSGLPKQVLSYIINRLKLENGDKINLFIDDSFMTPGKDTYESMENNIMMADLSLIICTPK